MQPPVDHVLVRTTKPKAAAAVRIGAGLGQQKRVELAGLLQVCFARVEPWLQARKYVSAVASGLARRNGWTIAEQAGDRSPDKTQRLLNRAVWDTWGAMGVVRRFAVAGLDEAAARSGRRRGLGVGGVDGTGPGKQGPAPAGRNRRDQGVAGRGGGGGTGPGKGGTGRGRRSWGCQRIWCSAPRGSWPSACAPTGSLTECGSTSCAATRCTATAPSCGSSARTAARGTCCGSGPPFTWSWPAAGRR